MSQPIGKWAFRLALSLPLLSSLPAHALDGGDHAAHGQAVASLVEVDVTGSLPPYIPSRLTESEPDTATLAAAVSAYRRGGLAEGDALSVGISHEAARAMLEWVALRSGTNWVSFARLNGFLQRYPDYPATSVFRRRAEEMLLVEKKDADTVRSFFRYQKPLSPAGRIALAIAFKAQGKAEDAAELVRRSWRQDSLGQAHEKLVLAQFGDVFSESDHRARSERWISRGNAGAALRNAARVSPGYVFLAKARLASAASKRPIAAALIESVPAAQRDTVSFILLQAQQARRENKPNDAARLLAKAPRDPNALGDGDEWWIERRLVARKLLDLGDSTTAYQVAAGHGAEDAAERIDAEWHAGFIALRFRNDANAALSHFSIAADQAETPISVARAAYWQGRASEALGLDDDARAFYERAALHPVAYYGQLARARLGFPDLPLRRAEAVTLDHLPGHQGVRMLYRIGARDLAATMLADLAQRLNTAPALETIAAIATRENDVRTLLSIGKASLQRGFPLDSAAFPTFGVPEFSVLGDPMERAIVHAIARQESAFDPTAMSPAGARGLMQMMPATARETARRAKLPFDWARLGRDPLYSAQMGAAHLNDLLKEWRGSYILTFAAYNAGSGNVKGWIEAYGDPRKADVDAVDWVERIPFYETRNYVQRVMENLQVYRQRLNQRTAFVIDQDLKRGGRGD